MVGVENLVGKKIGQRYFGGADEPVILFSVVVHVVTELGQVSRADHSLLTHHKRRVDFGVAVLAHAHIKEKVGQRPVQGRACAFEDVKARAAHLDPTFEVDDAQVLTQIPVRFGQKIELRRLAPAPHLDVVVLVGADRHAGAGHIRHVQLLVVQVGLDLAQLLVQGADFIAEAGHVLFLGLRLGLFALAHQLADGFAAGVTLLAQHLDFFQQLPPLPVEF